MDNNVDKEFIMYAMLDEKYKTDMSALYPGENVDNFYPGDWFIAYPISLRIDILIEALNKNILITQTELFAKNVEGVRNLG